MSAHIIPVIMCGGAGTRLWPVSRESMPKQFVPLVGEGSTFQQVLARISDASLFARPIVITNTDFRFVVAEQLREHGIEADIVLEPVAATPAPPLRVARCSRQNVIATLSCSCWPPTMWSATPRNFASLPARCRSRDRGTYRHLRDRAYASGDELRLHPPGQDAQWRTVHAVEAFVEKPDVATAATYVADGYLWNSGNFLFHAATMLAEIERFEPEMAEAAKAAVKGLTRDLDFLRLAAEPFARAPKKSIDYAVMERTKLAAVVPADIGWSDVGSWSAVWDVLDHDAAGNATEGPVVVLDSRNSLVRSEDSVLTTVIGLDDVIVVTTADAVLVSARESRASKGTGRAAQGANHRAAVEHRRIYRPWGYYQDVDMAPRYRVKRIVVNPAASSRCRSIFIVPSIGSWSREPPRSRSATSRGACTRTNRSTSRSEAFIAWPIPAKSRSN